MWFFRILSRINERFALNAFASSSFERAERQFIKAIERDPERPGLRYNLAVVMMSMGRFDDAEILFEKEREKFGSSFAIDYALADLAWVKADREAAKENFARVRDQAPTEKMKAFIDLRSKIAEDKDAFAMAMEGGQSFFEGVKAMETGDFDTAVAKLQEAVEKDPSTFLAWNNLGVIAMNHWKDFDSAYDYFSRADALADIPVVRQNLYKLDVARTKRAQKNL